MMEERSSVKVVRNWLTQVGAVIRRIRSKNVPQVRLT